MMLVNVSPEHARLSTLANKQIAFVVWSILRDDIRENITSGHYTKSDIKRLCSEFGYTTRHWTRIFASGEDVFWGNDDKMIHMRSMKFATRQLQRLAHSRIDTRSHFQTNVKIELTRKDSTQSIYAKLYWTWFLARGEVTISRDELQSLFGLSHDQQRAYEALLGKKILIRSNYCLIDVQTYQENPQDLPKHHHTFRYERLTSSQKVVDVKAIQYQLPNTYIAQTDGNTHEGTTPAAQSLRRANAARLWYASTHKHHQLYFAKWRDFERSGSLDSYVRSYYNGKKRLWLRGHYL